MISDKLWKLIVDHIIQWPLCKCQSTTNRPSNLPSSYRSKPRTLQFKLTPPVFFWVCWNGVSPLGCLMSIKWHGNNVDQRRVIFLNKLGTIEDSWVQYCGWYLKMWFQFFFVILRWQGISQQKLPVKSTLSIPYSGVPMKLHSRLC